MSNIQEVKNFKNFNSKDYIQLDNKELYLNYLKNELFGNSGILLGKIKTKHSNGDIFVEVYSPFSPFSPLSVPFQDVFGTWEVYGHLNPEEEHKLKETDFIIFEYELNVSKKEKELLQIIRIKQGTIQPLKSFQGWVENLIKYNDEKISLPETLKILELSPKHFSIFFYYAEEIYKRSFEKWEKDINESKSVLDGLNEQIDKQRGLLKSVIQEKNAEIETLNAEIKQKYSIIKELQKEAEKIQNDINKKKILLEDKLHLLGFSNRISKQPHHVEEAIQLDDDQQRIDYIHRYLWKKKQLKYDTSVVQRFYLGLKTNQIVILSGPSGTGKTSLVTAFAEATQSVAHIISVRPNWTDNQDLLGFYNPLERTYVSTPFLDALVRAKENPNQLHIICLDEMNLAHVEYYFSEFLSKRELENPCLHLYSEVLEQELLEEVSDVIFRLDEKIVEPSRKAIIDFFGNEFPEKYHEIKRKWNTLKLYPAVFEIPSNVRFVGTMNIDHTTKPLSPKVIDRSFVIEVLPCSSTEIPDLDGIDKPIYLLPENFLSEIVSDMHQLPKKSKELIRITDELNEMLSKFKHEYSERVRKQIIQYINESNWLTKEETLAQLIVSKILPRIYFSSHNQDVKYQKFKEFCEQAISCSNNHQLVQSKIEEMKAFHSSTSVVRYWG
jgi:energy-coupling factor transporter ATP-binding protein EcfA2